MQYRPIARLAVVVALSAAFVLCGHGFSVMAADLSLDHSQSLPGVPVIVVGDGFWGQEQVALSLTSVTPTDPLGSLIRRFTVAADGDGRFLTHLDLSETPEPSTVMQLGARGTQSGLRAELEMTVAGTRLSVVSPLPAEYCGDTLDSESRLTVCAELEQRCSDGILAPLPDRWLVFFVSTAACPAGNAEKRPSDSVLTDENGRACYTFAGLDTLYATGMYSIEVKFRQESAPTESEAPNGVCNPDQRIILKASTDCHQSGIIARCLPPIDFTVEPGDSADVYYVATADLDRDNHTDVIFTGLNTEGLFIAYGTSGAELEAPVRYGTFRQAAIVADHINGDTLIDVVATTSDAVYILTNHGNRVFTLDSLPLLSDGVPNTAGSGASRAEEVPALATGYFTDDNYLDIVVAPNLLLVGDGLGGYPTVISLPFFMTTVDACDFNADGRDDLVITIGDSAYILLNDGFGSFNQAGTIEIGEPQLEISPIETVADLNRDGWCDFAIVVPLASSPNQSRLTVGLTDRTGGITITDIEIIQGVAYDVTAVDVNKDNNLDIAVTNGTTNRIEVYFGDGSGQFDGPGIIDLGIDGYANYALASLDVDRDGNVDLLSGGLGGGQLVLAIDNQLDRPVLVDEMSTYALDGATIEVINPEGFVISEYFNTVAGSEFQNLDLNKDGKIDDRTLDFNLQYGEYVVFVTEEPGHDSPQPVSIGIGIDGSLQATVFDNYTGGYTSKSPSGADTTGVLVFFYTVEPESSIQPPNGVPVTDETPTFDWSKLVSGLPSAVEYDFQLDRYFDFRSPILDVSGLTLPSITTPIALGNDSIFYWRYRVVDNGIPSEYSRTFAAYVSGVCCFGRQGNINGDPDGLVDLSDAIALSNYLFLGEGNESTLCFDAANMDGNPEGIPDLGDLMALLNYLFLNGPPLAGCP